MNRFCLFVSWQFSPLPFVEEKQSWFLFRRGERNIYYSELNAIVLSFLYGQTELINIRLVDVDFSSENMLSLKRFSRQKVRKLGREAQVLKEKDLIKSISPSACVPQVLSTCVDQTYAAILLNTCIACPLASILRTPLDEPSAQFCTASLITALEDLHKVCCLQVAS